MKNLFFLLLGLLLITCNFIQSTTKKKIYYWQKGDSLQQITERFGDNLLEIRRRNNIYEPEDLFVGFPLIIIPNKHILPKQTSSTKKTAADKLQFIFPSQGTITSKYGPRNNKFHYGIDFGANKGKQIVAAAGGVVKRAGVRNGYGNTVEISHKRNITTLYAHLEKSLVKTRHKVRQKELIGIMGTTGNSSGVHLHFEIIVNGTYINPLTVLQ